MGERSKVDKVEIGRRSREYVAAASCVFAELLTLSGMRMDSQLCAFVSSTLNRTDK